MLDTTISPTTTTPRKARRAEVKALHEQIDEALMNTICQLSPHADSDEAMHAVTVTVLRGQLEATQEAAARVTGFKTYAELEAAFESDLAA
jgi:hypothetical protein